MLLKPTLTKAVLLGIANFFLLLISQAQQPGFPGAEGFGKNTTGGRGGSVYHVTNLNDSGPGSFRDAVSQPNRTVVFDVSGVINISDRIVISKNVTVAGQTAPGGGITLYGNGIALTTSSGNDIIRYIRIRMGKNGDSGKDAVGISGGQNYLFDHVSISWGRDGTLDVNGSGVDNLTFQDCIIGQGINNSNHSTGGLMQSGKWSMIRSLYIDNKTRNPKARGTHEFINSILYNWRENGYIMGDTQGLSECNLIGNYFIYGPSSSAGTHITRTTTAFHVYPEDNWIDSNKDGVLNGTLLTDYKSATVETSPYGHPGVNTLLSAQDALDHVIDHVGASLVRDAVDSLLIAELTSFGTLGQIINTEDDNGIPNNVGSVIEAIGPTDTDQDGMPDFWELDNGFNPNVADNNGDANSDGYTNLEEYLNWVISNRCEATAIAPSLSVNGGPMQQTSFLTVDSGATVTLSPEADGDGTWEWSGCGVSGTDREQTFTATSSCVATAIYTNGCDARSTRRFTVTVVGIGTLRIQENGDGYCGADGTVDSNNSGFTGSGFVNTTNEVGMGIDWQVEVPSAGTYSLAWRYANGGSSDRHGRVIINNDDEQIAEVSLPGTGDWTTWDETPTHEITLQPGVNNIRLEANTADGLANIDYLDIAGYTLRAGNCWALGIQDMEVEALRLFPNPSGHFVTLSLPDDWQGEKEVQVFDLYGRQVMAERFHGLEKRLSIQALPTGIYLLKVSQEGQVMEGRLVKR